MSRILVLDIETKPNLVYVWRFFKENVGPSQVVKNSEIMSYAAKWLGENDIFYSDTFVFSEKHVIESLVNLLNEADIVIAHYGSKFDVPRIRARCLALGIEPPSPFKVIDTKLVATKEFNFEGNSLQYLAEVLKCGSKLVRRKFPGFDLWLECLRGNKEAWDELQRYNIEDVIVLERIYYKMRPWITNHPNIATQEEGKDVVCPKCGSHDSQRRGYHYTQVGKYQRYRCNACGGWHRSRFSELNKEAGKALAVNAV